MRRTAYWLAFTLTILSPQAMAASIDPYGQLAALRIRTHGKDVARRDMTTQRMLDVLLGTPSSYYSDLTPRSGVPWTRETWWRSWVRRIRDTPDAPKDDALVLLRLQLGATRADVSGATDIPGESRITVLDSDRAAYATPYRTINDDAIANAKKAGISPPVFWKAWDFNPEMTTVAAAEAVAVQTLIDWMLSVPRGEWDAMDLRPDVVFRYLDAASPRQLIAEDRLYLRLVTKRILASSELIVIPPPDALRHPQILQVLARLPNGKVAGGSLTRSTLRLPAVYRIARLAAAYADASGYVSPPCEGHRPVRSDGAAAVNNGLPLCFTAATDRALHHWYTVEARRQARAMAEAIAVQDQPSATLQRMMATLGAVLAVVDMTVFVEEAFAMAEEASGTVMVDESASVEEHIGPCTGDSP